MSPAHQYPAPRSYSTHSDSTGLKVFQCVVWLKVEESGELSPGEGLAGDAGEMVESVLLQSDGAQVTSSLP